MSHVHRNGTGHDIDAASDSDKELKKKKRNMINLFHEEPSGMILFSYSKLCVHFLMGL